MDPERLEVIQSMESYVSEQLYLLKPVADAWQPVDFLPDFGRQDWKEQVDALQDAANALPDDVLVVLVGDMITEEALPSYQSWLNRLEGITDQSGADESPWAQWTRGWTAEENRHGDLLNRFLYLSGRVDMRAVEVTIQHLIRNGFAPKTVQDPYWGFIYTSFQERATRISHSNVGTLASKHGDKSLAKLSSMVAGDEAQHEKAYKTFVKKFFELDPAGTMEAFAGMMKSKILMPASLMQENERGNLFDHFASVAQKLGVYTSKDYASIFQHLIDFWNIESLGGLSGVAVQAQEEVCNLSRRLAKLAERMESRISKYIPRPNPWVFDRSV